MKRLLVLLGFAVFVALPGLGVAQTSPAITITDPGVGETWTRGSSQTITATVSNPTGFNDNRYAVYLRSLGSVPTIYYTLQQIVPISGNTVSTTWTVPAAGVAAPVLVVVGGTSVLQAPIPNGTYELVVCNLSVYPFPSTGASCGRQNVTIAGDGGGSAGSGAGSLVVDVRINNSNTPQPLPRSTLTFPGQPQKLSWSAPQAHHCTSFGTEVLTVNGWSALSAMPSLPKEGIIYFYANDPDGSGSLMIGIRCWADSLGQGASGEDTVTAQVAGPAAAVTLVDPAAPETWARGTTQTIGATVRPRTGAIESRYGAYLRAVSGTIQTYYRLVEGLLPMGNELGFTWTVPGATAAVPVFMRLGGQYEYYPQPRVIPDGTHDLIVCDRSLSYPYLNAQGQGNSACDTERITIGAQTNPAAPAVTLTAPNGGQVITKGQSHTVTWTAANVPADGYFKLKLKKGSTVVATLAASLPGTTRSYTWQPATTLANGSDYKVSIELNRDVANPLVTFDDSDGFFIIQAGTSNASTITITEQPGSTVTSGNATAIAWSDTSSTNAYNIYLRPVDSVQAASLTGGQYTVALNHSGRSFTWTAGRQANTSQVPTGKQYRLTICPVVGVPCATSNAFTLVSNVQLPAELSFSSVSVVGTTNRTVQATWTDTGNASGYTISFLNTNNVAVYVFQNTFTGLTAQASLPTSVPNGSYKFRVCAVGTDRCAISQSLVLGTTNQPTVTVTAPNAAVQWPIDGTRVISWQGTTGPVSINAVIPAIADDPASLASIATNVTGTSYSWTVGLPVGNYYIQVCAGNVCDNSDQMVTIRPKEDDDPAIAVSAQNQVTLGQSMNINVDVSKVNSTNHQLILKLKKGASEIAGNAGFIKTGPAVDGTVSWTPSTSLTPGSDYRVVGKIYQSSTGAVLVTDESEVITLVASSPDITVTATPQGSLGRSFQLSWSDGTGATGYDFFLVNNTTGATVASLGTNFTGGMVANASVPTSVAAGAYKIKVCATGSTRCGTTAGSVNVGTTAFSSQSQLAALVQVLHALLNQLSR